MVRLFHVNRSCKLWVALCLKLKRRIRHEQDPNCDFDSDQADLRDFLKYRYVTRVEA